VQAAHSPVSGDPANQDAALRHTVVIIDGGDLSARAVKAIPSSATIIAADGGLDRALAAGVEPHLLIGDLDSVSSAGREWAVQRQIEIREFSPDKDETDTELALAAAIANGCDDLLLLSGIGDRLDHTLGTVTALGGAPLHDVATVRMVWGDSVVRIAHPQRTLTLHPIDGATFSLLALHGACSGVTVLGARWSLRNAQLHPAASIGLSNQFLAETVDVTVDSGIVTVVQS
jgi:thiamine pyrophosphokinase